MRDEVSYSSNNSTLLTTAIVVLGLNVVLMLIKLGVGYVGNSYALIADGVESASDVFVSVVTWGGFLLSLKPADENHPFGHGKIESLVGIISGLALLAAAIGIAIFSIQEIRHPHAVPEWYTLPVLLVVVATKELLFRKVIGLTQDTVDSRALEGDAWHHRSDALTSAAAAIGIAIALIGGPDWAAADDWAALIACAIIFTNAIRIVRMSLHDALDGKVATSLVKALREEASRHPQVCLIEKCRVRKSGSGYFVEIHVQVDGAMSIFEGHALGHEVKDHLVEQFPALLDVTVHLEPYIVEKPSAE
ncbi:cation diffusion facilitator family transporter [Cerasicoccus frondis]|uniref:cation diffusion facilitator family transporter n=1 Tax=Cerasicoccus frondis TaxID=490090 RepID=UPI0028528EC7|nr:cation diffusion facilitator family transporter [Cerasicoccus frondis]